VSVLAPLGASPSPSPSPVIPTFGGGGGSTTCVAKNGQFCGSWFVDNFGSRFAPALVQHIELTAIAIGIGMVIAMAAALFAHRHRWFEAPFSLFAAFLYTVPALAFFELMVQVTGINRFTAEIALVSYTLLILFRNTLAGLRAVPPDALEAAQAMGLTRCQMLFRVELPLALPPIMAGLRIATVTTISLATVAAYIGAGGLGEPIFDGIQTGFKTEFIAAGVLAIVLALAADGLLVIAQRLLTPWARRRRA
jgi:osmoprotectant transport system permease protein